MPRPPKHLPQRAKAEWRRVAPAIVGIGAATAADLRAFELLVTALAQEAEAREILAVEGLTLPTAGAGRKSHPAVKVGETARAAAARLLSEFGLTPRGRQSVDLMPRYFDDDDGDGQSLDEFLASHPAARRK